MAATIKIKRSVTAGAPPSLTAGELAYSFAPAATIQGGDRLYISDGQMPVVIGGKYFTDRLNHTPGVLTASGALLVDADKKIDELLVDDIQINSNTIGTTASDADLILAPNGNGKVSINGNYTLPRLDGNLGDALVTDGQGNVSFQKISGELRIRGDDSAEDVVSLLNDTLEFLGSNSISTIVTDGTVLITIADASSSTKGVAQFSAAYFTVANGDVTIADASDSAKGLASFNSSNFTVSAGAVTAKTTTLGTTAVDVGSTVTTLAGIQQLDVDNIRIDGNEISATNVDGGISLRTQGTGVVSVNNTRITDLTIPINSGDAATKQYVDDLASTALVYHEGVAAATTGTLADATGGTIIYDNGVIGIGATLTTTGTFELIDTVNIQTVGTRILVKNEANAAHNGIYTYTSPTVITRATDADSYGPGADELSLNNYFFVSGGDVNKGSSYVIDSPIGTITFGTSNILFAQFSSSSVYAAGNGLTLTGTTFDVNVAALGGLEIVNDNLQIKSGIAGSGLGFTDGVINIGGTTDRITVNDDSIDIASTYIGQTSITTLGTIATGVWQGTAVGTAYGGTGLTTYNLFDLVVGTAQGALTTLAMGQAGQFLQVNAAGNALVYGDIDGGTY